MSKVHPAENKTCQNMLLKKRVVIQNIEDHDQDHHDYFNRRDNHDDHERPSVLTVWKRSSMSFQGTDGFTVFDQRGRLAFRVDNYSRENSCVKGGLLLMDGAGKALLTLKPQVFSIQNQWNAYRGEEGNLNNHKSSKIFSMMRSKSFFSHNMDKNAEAEVFLERTRKGQNKGVNDHQTPDFRIEGCFWRRNCKIRNRNGEVVANISRKKVNDRVLLGNDVFSLVVQPGYDAQLIMSFVIVLDRICVKPYAPVLCS